MRKTKEAPQRAYVLKLSLQADTKDKIIHTLRSIAWDIEMNEKNTASVVCDDVYSGYHYNLKHHPEQTHEKYMQAVDMYKALDEFSIKSMRWKSHLLSSATDSGDNASSSSASNASSSQ